MVSPVLFLLTSVTNELTTKNISFVFWKPVKSRIWQKESPSSLLISQGRGISQFFRKEGECAHGSRSELLSPGWLAMGSRRPQPPCPDCRFTPHKGDEVAADSFFPLFCEGSAFILLANESGCMLGGSSDPSCESPRFLL